MSQTLPENPLPACPGTPNCLRESRFFSVAPDTLFALAQETLQKIGASEITPLLEERTLAAVCPIFIYKDDVHIAIAPHGDGTILHIRSASREGTWDLGVNGRRVRRFFRTLNNSL